MHAGSNCRSKVTYKPVQTSINMPDLESDGLTLENQDEEKSTIHECNVAFLGCSKVGKSSILQQLVHQTHEEKYTPTPTYKKYYQAAYVNGRLYDMTLRDCPGVNSFPADTVNEWTDYRGYGLHLCQVFVLVYDVCNKNSFDYVLSMKDQIHDIKGNEALVIIVGNKYDLNDPRTQAANRSQYQQSQAKKWKAPYVLCSAKYNYHVVDILKEIVRSVESKGDSKKDAGNRANGRWRQFNCTVS